MACGPAGSIVATLAGAVLITTKVGGFCRKDAVPLSAQVRQRLAGITQLEGQNVRAGVYLVSGGYTFDAPNGTQYKASSDFVPVPQFYATYTPQDSPLSFGLGLYAPYGLSLDWGPNTPFFQTAEKGSLLYLCLNPVIAYKIHPNLSIAIGPTFNYSEADFTQGFQPAPGFPIGQTRLQGNGWAYGFNAGLRWQPHEKWAFGVSYRYLTTVDYEGTFVSNPPYTASANASASIRFPQFIVGGVSFRPTPDWNLEFDIDWTDWDNVNQIPIQSTLPVPPITLNYRSSFMYEVGVTRQLGKGYFASLGYFYSENSSPDQNFTPAIPDADLHLGGIGFGHRGKKWDWTLAYQFGYNPGRDVTSDLNTTANGTYHVLNHAINIAATFKF